jgi:AAA ATPase domain
VALINRVDELASLGSLLDAAETGSSSTLVLRGEAGVGKTALLTAVTELAVERGMVTSAIAGIEEEAPIGWAALHRVLQHFRGSIDGLPPPQRDALRSTLGLEAGPPPDHFLVGLGVLTLLADRATERPLVTVIDDAQWLDPESGTIFGFVARRLYAESVVMLFAVRELADPAPPWVSRCPS